MSIELLELAANALDPLLHEVVFLGGASVPLWITDPGAPPPRPTKDVDVVVEVATRLEFHSFEGRLRVIGFNEDQEEGVICRWRHRETGLVLDAMPADATILGFENKWQAEAIPYAVSCHLPSGATIRVAAPQHLLATKIEAFKSRGREDFLGSRDMGDIIILVDGREELAADICGADPAVRTYIAEEMSRLIEHPRFRDGVFAALQGDAASQDRAETVVMPRIKNLIAGRL